ncbi:YkgJ family cysteine cluster protein [bacterium]|nr:YkgJ family cysteine cluster protein [bacterium]
MKLPDFLASIKNEILSHFVTEKIMYKIEGKCNKCGKCCNYMYSFDTYTEKEFKFMQFLFPAYKRFYIKGKDDMGNLIFACKYVTPEGLCSVYDKRLKMCKNYPAKYITYDADLHEGCGYHIVKKTFDDYMKESDKVS